jgi:hypothetical protein
LAFDQARRLAAEFGAEAMRTIEMMEDSQEAGKPGSQEA